MKVTYDPEVDAMRIVFREGGFAHTEELQEGILADYDAQERILAIEILDASEKVDAPDGIEFRILKANASATATAA